MPEAERGLREIRRGSGAPRTRRNPLLAMLRLEATVDDLLKEPHAIAPEDTVRSLGSDALRGLTEGEAAERLAVVGLNELRRAEGPAYLRIALGQVADPLVGLLLAAAFVSAAIGETLEAGAIAAIVVFNAAFGFVQEAGATRAVLALRSATVLRALVVRGGVARELPARELVPGDLVRLREGDRVPADARVLSSIGLEAEEAALTGESAPVHKDAAPVSPDTPLAERTSLVHAGTGITRGAGVAVVFATGENTEQGAIAQLTEDAPPPPTPLQRRLGALAGRLAVLGVGITAALTTAMLLRGEPLRDAFLLGVSVAVAAVPEGLAATVTIALALGAREMAQRGAVVRSLSAIETIGEATVVCTDKTGTLTENRLRVDRVLAVPGGDEVVLLAAALAAAEAEIDPVDRALIEAARAAGTGRWGPVVRSVPFEASRKRAAVVVESDTGLQVIVKGAPEVLFALVQDRGAQADLLETAADWARDGLRVLALACGPVERSDLSEDELERDLRPLGLIGLVDPLRATAAASIAAARDSGLSIRMLTGDHPGTANAVGRLIGLSPGEVEARCSPADKLALVERLEAEGEIVIVTGDGVNDAPALRRAHVGVAMGLGGTEAAREAASIVLTDDDFATIVAAVREGRRIAGNVRAFLAFLLSANLGEVVLFAVAVIAGLGAPMTVVQVLLVNLVTDGPPAVALARDPAGADALARRPGGTLLPRPLVAALAAIGVTVGLASLGAFLAVRGTRPEAAQTAAFATVALAELLVVFSCRSERLAAWALPRNRALELAVLVSLALVAACIYLPALHGPFGTVGLTLRELAVVLLLAAAPFVVTETLKAVIRWRESSSPTVRLAV